MHGSKAQRKLGKNGEKGNIVNAVQILQCGDSERTSYEFMIEDEEKYRIVELNADGRFTSRYVAANYSMRKGKVLKKKQISMEAVVVPTYA